MGVYLLALLGVAVAMVLLWTAFLKKEKPEESVTVYSCTHCGEHHCICEKKDPSKA